jgi:hypothetical protein
MKLLATITGLVILFALPSTAIAGNVWLVAPEPGAVVTSNYPTIRGDVSEGWLAGFIRIADTPDVDAAGMLTSSVASIDTNPTGVMTIGEAFNSDNWIYDTPGRPLFPGEYWVQASGTQEDYNTDTAAREWSPPRRFVVRRVVSRPTSESGDTIYGSTSAAWPYTVMMTTNLKSVPLAVRITLNGRLMCSANRPMTFQYGTDQSVARKLMCRAKNEWFKDEGENVIRVVARIGSRATTGAVWRINKTARA